METIRANAVIFACAVAASKDWKGLFSSSDGNMIFTYNLWVISRPWWHRVGVMRMTNEAEKQEASTEQGGLIDPVVMCWTPVSEELPDNGKMVLVTINTETPCSDVSSYTPCDGGQWYRWQEADEYKTDTPYYSDYDMEITHWMYMPEAFGT